MHNKVLWISLFALLSLAGCKTKVQDPSSTPAADATPKIMEQTQAPMESQDQSPAASADSESTTQAAVGTDAEQMATPSDMSTSTEEGAAATPEAQPETTAPESTGEPSDTDTTSAK